MDLYGRTCMKGKTELCVIISEDESKNKEDLNNVPFATSWGTICEFVYVCTESSSNFLNSDDRFQSHSQTDTDRQEIIKTSSFKKFKLPYILCSCFFLRFEKRLLGSIKSVGLIMQRIWGFH